MRENIIAGLDIGSNTIKLVIGQMGADMGENTELKIIGAVETASGGISRGAVKSIDDTTSAISACLEKAERLIGVPIESVWSGINCPYIKCERSRGVVAVGKSDGEIMEDDVRRAVEAAQAMSVPPNYEILQVIPVKYSVDNQDDIRDPIGMTGVRLEVEVLVIRALSNYIKNLTKAIYRTKLEIEDLVLSPLAAAEAVITPKQKELGAALINIGAATTSLAVFEEGELLHTAILPIGSEHITADIAIGLRIPINLAERIKLELGNANSEIYSKKDAVNIKSLIEEEGAEGATEEISVKYLSEIIEARVEEIFEKIDDELKKIDRSGMLPAGVFLTGGGVKLPGLVDLAKAKLRLPASLGISRNVYAVIDKVNDPIFLPALGLVSWGALRSERKSGGWHGSAAVGKSFEKIKNIFKSLIP